MSAPLLVDLHGRPLKPSARIGLASGYEGASSDRQQTRNWSTASIPAQGETDYAREPLAARAQDLNRNNGKAKGSSRKLVDRTVGKGLRFRSRPDFRTLGVDVADAVSFGRGIERELNAWANGQRPQCDIKRRLNFGQIQRLLFRGRKINGETLVIMRWRPDRDTRYATCMQLLDPQRLSNPNNAPDTEYLRQGVELNDDGEPIAYWIRDAHENDFAALGKAFSWTRVPRLDDDGRLVCLHSFEDEREEQVRGVSVFAPILLAFRDVQRFSEAEIGAAIINAVFAGFIKSNFDPVAVAQSLELDTVDPATIGETWQERRLAMMPEQGYRIGDNRVGTLPPGDEFEMNNNSRENGGFAEFEKAVDRGIAAGLGLDYPSFANNLEGVNYSSFRGGLLDVWRMVTADRFEFTSDTLLPIAGCVIQEAFERRYLVEPNGFPAFEEFADAYLAGSWIGPGRGTIDPMKEAAGHKMEAEFGLRSMTDISQERGYDYEETLDDLVMEQQMRDERGLNFSPLRDLAGVMPSDGQPSEE